MSEKKMFTAKEVSAQTAGGDSYIRTKNNVVRGLAITLEKNPEAPDIIIVGDGARIKENAELFKQTITPVKTFIKHDTDKWEYVGRYKVKYYSKGNDRIFKRSPAVIGKKVQNCHPPKSLDKVNAILNDFKQNKRDFAEFWIPLGELFVYIRYFPVRDERGNYLGTLEVTQEISRIKTLDGEKRLLD